MKTITVTRHGKPYKMTLDEVWSECLRMWWNVSRRRMTKRQWLDRNGYGLVSADCFFCAWHDKHHLKRGGECPGCPGERVDKTFNCQDDDYDYLHEPKPFYRKLRALDKKRSRLMAARKAEKK